MKFFDIRKAGLAAVAALIAFGAGLMTGPSPASALVISSGSVLVQDTDDGASFSFSLTQTAEQLHDDLQRRLRWCNGAEFHRC
jgi:parvulin-like peptidyl-prolyl isomerase